jgi:putative ABC transport system ATP-binding protein
VLQLQDLSHRYGPADSLRFPNLTLDAGRHLLVRGNSGSGKSTLLALIAGLLTPSSGHVRVGAIDVGALPPRARDRWRGAQLGFVPQRLHLSPSLTVTGNLELPFVCAGEAVDASRIGLILQRLGIMQLAERRPHELSVGQAQRVALARALLRHPKIILADEPTASLDDDSAATAMALLAQAANDAHATLVLATHDARVAAWLPGAAELQLPAASSAVRHEGPA